MKIKIDGKYCEVPFLSFFKGWILSWILFTFGLIVFFAILGVVLVW
jgi:hypothetical protein